MVGGAMWRMLPFGYPKWWRWIKEARSNDVTSVPYHSATRNSYSCHRRWLSRRSHTGW